MLLTFRPIKTWPENWNRQSLDRANSPFDTTYTATLDLLDRELHQLGGRNAVLQVDATDRECRLDGQLRANATVRHPGAILTFDTRKHGTLTYACDRFQRQAWKRDSPASWQHNLRAIALGPGTMTFEDAARLLWAAADCGLPPDTPSPDDVSAIYRQAARQAHPDAGGDPAVFRRLTEARDLLLADK